MEKHKVSFEQECPTIGYTFELLRQEESYFPIMLTVKFTGLYRDGSEGAPDATLMKGAINTAMDLWEPQALLIDLSEFEYNWGDDIDRVLDEPSERVPYTIVIGPKCREALSSLAFGPDTEQDIVDDDIYFDSLEKAAEKLIRLVKKD